MPFVYTPPRISLGILDDAWKFASAAIPQLLKIVHEMKSANAATFYSVREKIEDAIGQGIDGRLLSQYALSIVFSNQVWDICTAF